MPLDVSDNDLLNLDLDAFLPEMSDIALLNINTAILEPEISDRNLLSIDLNESQNTHPCTDVIMEMVLKEDLTVSSLKTAEEHLTGKFIPRLLQKLITYTGINATDINVTAGRYGANKVPFDVGLEGLGMIEGVGSGIPQNMIGQSVGYIFTGSFAEYVILPAKYCLPLPSVKPEYIPLLISGLTASIAFEQFGHLKPKENVLITAAAGGTGHIAVQLAKQAGCYVIGTCSSKSKVDLLKKLGCDHVINYKEENLFEVLKRDYPSGIDVVYESIGGDVFDACLNRLAVNGRMIVLGYINSYHSPAGIDRSQKNNTLVTKLLLKSGSVCGFFLMNHMKQYPTHLAKLVQMVDDGRLKVLIEHCDDNGHQFKGLEAVFKGVDYLYSQRSKGKIVIDLKNGSSKL